MSDGTGASDDAADVEDPEARLAAFQLADSALPVGGFAVSYGLEQFVAEGLVEDGDGLRELLGDYLRGHVGPCEFVVLSAAHRAAAAGDLDGVAAADRRQRAVTLPAEFREGSVASGGRLLDVIVETTDDERAAAYADRVAAGDAPGNYAAVLGLGAAGQGISRLDARLLYGHAFLTDQLGAAQRLLRLGHTDVQRVLSELRPAVASLAETHDDTDPAAARSFAPTIDLMGMAHEDADRRLFVS